MLLNWNGSSVQTLGCENDRIVRTVVRPSMTWFGRARSFSAAIAVVAALAWITGTNHCALGFLKRPSDLAALVSHCPGHCSEPGAARDGASGMLACCQGLLSSNFEIAKANIPFPVVVANQLFTIDRLALPQDPRSVFCGKEDDTGPPSTRYFINIVLRRSLPENAPPLIS